MSLQVILGDQLFPRSFYKDSPKNIFMCEDFELCTHFRYHKHKIIFFLASMRHFSDELKDMGKTVHYQKLDKDKAFFEALKHALKKTKSKKIEMFEIEDHFFNEKIREFCEEHEVELQINDSPMFLTTRQEFNRFVKEHKRPLMRTFYEGKRKDLEILLNKDGSPRGGKFSFDQSNRKKIPKNKDVIHTDLPARDDKHIKAATALVKEHFNDHPGSCENFWMCVTRRQALAWYNKFLDERFENFGDYQDALDERDPFLYHAVISPYMNNGFLPVEEVIDKALAADAPMNSKEVFIRQVLGWREFMRGMYHRYADREASSNFFNHSNSLTEHWYDGTTGIPPLDDAIKKAQELGYCHHIERLMVISNLMLLCEIHPREVYSWFMEMFVDSADWVMTPNVFGMGQFSDGGIFATKPYICGANYLRKMGHYKAGEWTDIVDGLYWRFIDKNLKFFKEQPRMNMMVSSLNKMGEDRKKKIFSAADSFIKEKTKA
ncbi:MAG: cryptochrome/photolyase family protein [Bacteriovoracaceae bacterium]|nr:cryptochrome/photolyase family protein [Bacteriovoracaceae bacterium]